MSGTADLRSEHRAVERMLDIMDAVAVSARRGDRVSTDDLGAAVEFLRVFVDACHHTKEERLLFPAMRAATIPGVEEMIGVLLADHERGRGTVTRIAESVSRMDAGDGTADPGLPDDLERYTTLLRAHIAREEAECFDAADRGLAPGVVADLREGYERVEADVVGAGVHEAFHALLDRLEREYHA